MKRKYIVIAIAAALVAGAGTLALFGQSHMRRAQMGFGMMHGHGAQAIIQHLTKRFNLTQAQQTEVQQMWEAEKPTVMPLLQQLAENHKQMLAAEANGAFNQAQVSAIANRQAQVLSQLIVEKEKLTAKFYTLLTPEQRTQFETMRQHQLTHVDNFLQRLANPSQSAGPSK